MVGQASEVGRNLAAWNDEHKITDKVGDALKVTGEASCGRARTPAWNEEHKVTGKVGDALRATGRKASGGQSSVDEEQGDRQPAKGTVEVGKAMVTEQRMYGPGARACSRSDASLARRTCSPRVRARPKQKKEPA